MVEREGFEQHGLAAPAQPPGDLPRFIARYEGVSVESGANAADADADQPVEQRIHNRRPDKSPGDEFVADIEAGPRDAVVAEITRGRPWIAAASGVAGTTRT